MLFSHPPFFCLASSLLFFFPVYQFLLNSHPCPRLNNQKCLQTLQMTQVGNLPHLDPHSPHPQVSTFTSMPCSKRKLFLTLKGILGPVLKVAFFLSSCLSNTYRWALCTRHCAKHFMYMLSFYYMQLSKLTSSIYIYTHIFLTICIMHTCIYLYIHGHICEPDVLASSGLLEITLSCDRMV